MSLDNSEWEECDDSFFITETGKLRRGSIDDYYIEAYLDCPVSKLGALQTAFIAVCIDKVATKDMAHKLHKRLKPQIEAQLIDLDLEDKSLGRSVLRELCQNAESESVKASTATTLSKGLYPDVKVVKEMSFEDINKEIDKLEEDQKGVVEGWAH